MKLCFAFLTNGYINNEIVWYEFFKNLDNIEILIHCTDTPRFQYLNNLTNKIFINSVRSSWGRLQRLQNFLMERAKELMCDKFIILSNSCLPVRNFNYIFNNLSNATNLSFISNSEAWDLSRFPNKTTNYKFMSNQQWCIIDKSHYDIFLNDSERAYFEDNVTLPEESYYSCIIEKINMNNDNNIINKPTTYLDWKKPTNRGNSPYVFGEDYDIDIINKIVGIKDIMFIRKVKDDINCNFVKRIREIVNLP